MQESSQVKNQKCSNRQIIEFLADNPRETYEHIAKLCRISAVALQNRLNRLRKDDSRYAEYRRVVLLRFEWAVITHLLEQSEDGKTQASITLLQMMGSLPKEQATVGGGWNVNVTMRQLDDGGKEMTILGSPKPTTTQIGNIAEGSTAIANKDRV
jgi:hypothetical protein